MSETPETTMRPEDVPAELVERASEQAYGTPLEPGDDRRSIARALAAVLPAHEAMVRAKVAEEIEQRRPSSTTPGPRHKHYWMGMTRAAHIARGEQP